MKLRYIAEAGKRIYTPRIKEFAKELGVHPNILRRYFKLGCPQTSVEDIKKWREEYLRRPGKKKPGRKPTSRIKELAKETGLSAITLREYFKLGCPQTSAEDIKKWREEYLRRPGGRQVYTPRIEELAKEVGIHPGTLREYFKLGCPQTSAEDIKKWREEYVGRPGWKQVHTPRIREFAKELGVHPVLLRRYFKLGCPQTSVEDIKKWREEYLRRPGGRQIYTPRIEELAKEAGLSVNSLREYFKLGCPQTSVEDIKKWREEHVGKPGREPIFTPPHVRKLAKETGLSISSLRNYFKLGCPQTSAEDIKKWREEHVRKRYKSQNPAEQQAVINRVAKRVSEGAKLQEIADELNADGIKTWSGKPWTSGLVHWVAKMTRSRQHTTESKRDFRSLLESVLNY